MALVLVSYRCGAGLAGTADWGTSVGATARGAAVRARTSHEVERMSCGHRGFWPLWEWMRTQRMGEGFTAGEGFHGEEYLRDGICTRGEGGGRGVYI